MEPLITLLVTSAIIFLAFNGLLMLAALAVVRFSPSAVVDMDAPFEPKRAAFRR